MELLINGTTSTPKPLALGRDVIVGIDSSKSDSGLVIMDPRGQLLADVDFLGGGESIDVYDFCYDIRKNLDVLFRDARIIEASIEDVITTPHSGTLHHKSRTKITAVFDAFEGWFHQRLGHKPNFVNNQTWKASILPSEYNTKDIGKGSVKWLKAIGHPLGMRGNDNITDAYCIALYTLRFINFKVIPNTLETGSEGYPKYKLYGVMDSSRLLDIKDYQLDPTDNSSFSQICKSLALMSFKYHIKSALRIKVKDIPIKELFEINFKGEIPKHVEEFDLIVEAL